MLRYGSVLVFIFPLFPCSKLTGHEVTHIPTVTVGPYQPWDWDTNLLTRLRQPYQAEGTQTNIATGYQTNIIIDQVTLITDNYHMKTTHCRGTNRPWRSSRPTWQLARRWEGQPGPDLGLSPSLLSPPPGPVIPSREPPQPTPRPSTLHISLTSDSLRLRRRWRCFLSLQNTEKTGGYTAPQSG